MPDPQRPARGRKPSAPADPVALAPAPAPDPTPTPTPTLAPPAPIDLGTPPPRDLRDVDFFVYLHALTPGEWDDRVVYLYRQNRDVGKADPSTSKYVAKFSGPFDEETVAERFGGGKFLAIVKNQRSNEAERKHSFEVDGQPRLQADEILKVPPGAAGAGGTLEQLVGNLTERLVSLAQETKKHPGGDEDAVARVAQTMQKGMEGIVSMMQSAMLARDQSATGNPLTDRLLETALQQLRSPAAAADPAESLRSAIALVKDLGLLGGGGGGRGSLRELLGELREVFGVEPAALLGGGAAGGDWKAALGAVVPQVLQVGHELLQTWRLNSERNYQVAVMQFQSRGGAAGAPAATPPPGMAAPPAQPATPATDAAAAPPPSPLPPAFSAPATPAIGRMADGTPDFDWVRQFVVRQFKGQHTGEFVANMLQEFFPDQVEFFAQAFGNAQELADFSKMDPILSEIAGDTDFAEFVEEFAMTMRPVMQVH